jgi:putative ABC transport system substrate-binding protein
VAWPLAARAQQSAKIPRIGILDDAQLGYVEGQNIAYEYRYGEGAPDRLATVAAELVRLPVDPPAGCAGWRSDATGSSLPLPIPALA